MKLLLLLASLGIYFQDSLWIPGGYLNGVAFDGSYVWVTNNQTGSIYKINKELSLEDSLTFQTGINGIGYAQGLLWVAVFNDNTIKAIDPETGEEVLSFPVPGEYSYGLTYDGRSIWHSSKLTQEIRSIDPSSGSVISTFRVPFEPRDLGFYGSRLWAIGIINGLELIFIVDPSNGEVLRSVQFTRSHPAGIAIFQNTLWVSTTAGTGKLYKIDAISVNTEEVETAQSPRESVIVFKDFRAFLNFHRVQGWGKVYRINGETLVKMGELGGTGFSLPGYFIIQTNKKKVFRKVLILSK